MEGTIEIWRELMGNAGTNERCGEIVRDEGTNELMRDEWS